MNTIHISITGKVQIGKSAVLQSIKQLLESHNYCVAVPDREERHNPSSPIESAKQHEKPSKDDTVFILSERLG